MIKILLAIIALSVVSFAYTTKPSLPTQEATKFPIWDITTICLTSNIGRSYEWVIAPNGSMTQVFSGEYPVTCKLEEQDDGK